MAGSDVSRTGGSLDEGTVAELYRRFAPLVHSRARRMVGDDADDVVQEVFMRLIRRPPASDRLASWIYTVSTHVCMDLLRRNARRGSAWRDNLREHLVAHRCAAERSPLEDRELCLQLLARADKKTQQVVALVVFDEMDRQRAAELLGITRKTVYSRLKSFTDAARKQVERCTS
jgi:RNA polymerase sigma-70 factor (ECF subfamily)